MSTYEPAAPQSKAAEPVASPLAPEPDVMASTEEAQPAPKKDASAPSKTKKKRRKWPWILLAVLILMGVGGAIQSGREKPVEIQTAIIEHVPMIRAEVSASGTIEARNSVDIQAEIAGNIIELPVEEGQWVEKGDVLVRIDPNQTLADHKATEAQLAAARADARAQEVQVAQSQANLARDEAFKAAALAELEQATLREELAGKRLRRAQDLFDGGVSSEDELDAAVSESRLAAAAVKLSNARVEQYDAQIKATDLIVKQSEEALKATQQRAEAAAANLDRWNDWLAKTTIRSPLSGLITALNVDEGERAVPGMLSNPQATLMTIADMSVLEAWIEVDESDIVKVRTDNSVSVEVDALPGHALRAGVTEIGYAPVVQATGAQEGKDFLVKAALTQLDEDLKQSLRPGMSCDATIVTATEEDVLVMPIQAWTPREVAVDAEGQYDPQSTVWPRKEKSKDKTIAQRRQQGPREELDGVFVLDGDRVRFRPIETGIIGDMDLQIIKGLNEGEEIVVGPFKVLRELSDDDWVKVDNTESFYSNRENKSE